MGKSTSVQKSVKMENSEKRKFDVSRLIFLEITGCASGEEKQELAEWRKENPENENLYRQLCNTKKLALGFRWLEQVDTLSPREEMYLRIAAARKRKHLLWLRRSAAAIAVLLIVAGGFLYFRQRPVMPLLPVTEQPIMAGMPRAILHLGDGRTINLDTLNRSLEQGDVRMEKTEQRKLTYVLSQHRTVSAQEILYHEIEVPRGGEFDLILADGTVVWLNADSRLRYPVEFAGKERRVILEGEAYFQVKKNPDLPFRVEIRGQVVEVLGTEFNISGYKEEENIYTTLVNGKVKIATSRGEIALLPGEQCIMDTGSGLLTKQEVKVEKVVSWKEGKFILEEQTLEQIMQQFIRWYDITVFYQNPELKHKVFKGSVPRYSELQQVLNILTKTGEVSFKIQNRTVVVYE